VYASIPVFGVARDSVNLAFSYGRKAGLLYPCGYGIGSVFIPAIRREERLYKVAVRDPYGELITRMAGLLIKVECDGERTRFKCRRFALSIVVFTSRQRYKENHYGYH
jgi:hypothetical protein